MTPCGGVAADDASADDSMKSDVQFRRERAELTGASGWIGARRPFNKYVDRRGAGPKRTFTTARGAKTFFPLMENAWRYDEVKAD
jgi:hypothetical protein